MFDAKVTWGQQNSIWGVRNSSGLGKVRRPVYEHIESVMELQNQERVVTSKFQNAKVSLEFLRFFRRELIPALSHVFLSH